jgi:multidrug efflux pump subunit AcrA (membrane-fusion protein)
MMKLTEPVPTSFSGAPVAVAPPVRARRHRIWIAGAGVIAFLAIGAVGYTQFRDQSPSSNTPNGYESGSPELTTARATRQTIRKIIEQPGHIEGYEQTPMFVKIPGFVQVWKTDMGAWVKEGDVLAELSVPEEVEELKRREATAALAVAEVVASEKALEAAIADEKKAEAVVRQAEATKVRADVNLVRWKADLKRTEQAREKGAASENDYDVSLQQFKTAEAGVVEAKAGIDSAIAALASAAAAHVRAVAAVAVAKAQVAVAEADARRQREWLKYATVRAPFDGVVSKRNVEVRQYVMPPTSGSTQPPLFVVVRTDPVRIFVDVPESEAALIRDGMSVVVRIQSRGDLEIPGRVSRMSWALDQNSRTMRVQVDLPNADRRLQPGGFAVVRLVTERSDAWMVPASVVVTTDEQPYAVRVEDGKTIKTPVKIGARQLGMIEVLQKQTRPALQGEPIPWEPLTGKEEFLKARPAGWFDGMRMPNQDR